MANAKEELSVTGKYSLNGSLSSGRWSSVVTKFQNSQNVNIYEGNQSPISIEFFENLRFPDYGLISFRISGNLILNRQLIISNINALVRIIYYFD